MTHFSLVVKFRQKERDDNNGCYLFFTSVVKKIFSRHKRPLDKEKGNIWITCYSQNSTSYNRGYLSSQSTDIC